MPCRHHPSQSSHVLCCARLFGCRFGSRGEADGVRKFRRISRSRFCNFPRVVLTRCRRVLYGAPFNFVFLRGAKEFSLRSDFRIHGDDCLFGNRDAGLRGVERRLRNTGISVVAAAAAAAAALLLRILRALCLRRPRHQPLHPVLGVVVPELLLPRALARPLHVLQREHAVLAVLERGLEVDSAPLFGDDVSAQHLADRACRLDHVEEAAEELAERQRLEALEQQPRARPLAVRRQRHERIDLAERRLVRVGVEQVVRVHVQRDRLEPAAAAEAAVVELERQRLLHAQAQRNQLAQVIVAALVHLFVGPLAVGPARLGRGRLDVLEQPQVGEYTPALRLRGRSAEALVPRRGLDPVADREHAI